MTIGQRAAAGRDRHSTRTSTACEHCRATRTKCQASEQPGVCARCLSLRRDCVIRTKSRPRRMTRVSIIDHVKAEVQTPGHLGTFSINYTVPVRLQHIDPIEALRDLHNHVFSSMSHQPDAASENHPKLPKGTAYSSSAVMSHRSEMNRPDAWRQPLFDMASAETLLEHFKSTSHSYLPFVRFSSDDTVVHLNATKPFVLLAIMTVASGATLTQKHALYDNEFQTALSLKYIAGGERNLELLQGVLIYCAWHPFHLRPKDGRLVRCLRIVSELLFDLHLDEKLQFSPDTMTTTELDEHLDMARAYLAYIYLMLTWAFLWRGQEAMPVTYASLAPSAAELLEQSAQEDGDYTLVALVRISSLFSSTAEVIERPDSRVATDCQSLLSTFHASKFSDNHQSTDGTVHEAVKMQAMFVDIFLDCGGLLNFPVSKTYPTSHTAPGVLPSLPILYRAVDKVKSFLDLVADLRDSSILSFTINDWTRLIAILTLAFRLSFPLPLCPDFSPRHTRSILQLDDFLEKMSQGAGAMKSHTDLLSASRFVLGLAKAKYETRLAASEGEYPQGSQPGRSFSRTFGCPMMMPGGLNRPERQSKDISCGGNDQKYMTFGREMWAAMSTEWPDEETL